jgi:HlyD family secretion protein
MKSLILSFSVLVLFTSCAKKEATFDATGSFEADEIIISSEVMGKILYLAIEEFFRQFGGSVGSHNGSASRIY